MKWAAGGSRGQRSVLLVVPWTSNSSHSPPPESQGHPSIQGHYWNINQHYPTNLMQHSFSCKPRSRINPRSLSEHKSRSISVTKIHPQILVLPNVKRPNTHLYHMRLSGCRGSIHHDLVDRGLRVERGQVLYSAVCGILHGVTAATTCVVGVVVVAQYHISRGVL